MNKAGLFAAVLLLGCGGSTTVTVRPPLEEPVVRIQVAVPEMYKGWPLTITAEPLPVPIDTTVLGALPNQYEIDLKETELTDASFQLLMFDPAESVGRIVGTVDLLSELARFDLRKNGTPSVVGILITTGTAASPQQVVAPHVDTILVEWADGRSSTFVYD